MNCDVCQENDATVYLTQIVKGKMQKVNLCEECAKQKGVTNNAIRNRKRVRTIR